MWYGVFFVFSIPYDLLSEEVRVDSMQPVDNGDVRLLCSRLLNKINHKSPEKTEHTYVFFYVIFKNKLTKMN